jgi:hypothetical protein
MPRYTDRQTQTHIGTPASRIKVHTDTHIPRNPVRQMQAATGIRRDMQKDKQAHR